MKKYITDEEWWSLKFKDCVKYREYKKWTKGGRRENYERANIF